jgi:arylsulfatase A-like enzyme
MKPARSLLCVFAPLREVQAAAPSKPNIVYILADDLGYGDLACYGAKDVATPHIDQLAREGAKFTSCYVAPVCSPTRASLMTGSIAQRVGIGDNSRNQIRRQDRAGSQPRFLFRGHETRRTDQGITIK